MMNGAVGEGPNQGASESGAGADWEAAMKGAIDASLQAHAETPEINAIWAETDLTGADFQAHAEKVEAEDRSGSEELEAWKESVSGTPEEFWERLSAEKREDGTELGEMPDLRETDIAIENFFENGIEGVEGKARETRAAMAKKAVLNDIAKYKGDGGEVNDKILYNVFYATQRILGEMYRGNKELREGAKNEDLTEDEAIVWRMKMDPRGAKMDVVEAMTKHTRRAGESADDYETRLRKYAEGDAAQTAEDQAYNAAHPEEAMAYAAKVLENGGKDDLPEFEEMDYEDAVLMEKSGDAKGEKAEKPEREGRIKKLFEKIKGRMGFRKVVDKVKKALKGFAAVVKAEAEMPKDEADEDEAEVEDEETSEAETETEEGREAETEESEAETDAAEESEAEEVGTEESESEISESAEDEAEEAEVEDGAEEMDLEERLKHLGFAKIEVEKRVKTAADNEAQLHWMTLAKEIDDKIIQLKVEGERVRRAKDDEFQPWEPVAFAGEFGIEKLKTDGVIAADAEVTLGDLKELEKNVEAKILEAAYAKDEITENHYRSQMEFIQMAIRGKEHEAMKAEQAAGEIEAKAA